MSHIEYDFDKNREIWSKLGIFEAWRDGREKEGRVKRKANERYVTSFCCCKLSMFKIFTTLRRNNLNDSEPATSGG